MYIDTHAHIDHLHIRGLDVDEEIGKAKSEGLVNIVQSINYFEDNFSNIELAKKYEGFVRTMVGVHPQQALKRPADWFEQLDGLISENRNLIVGVGEIGIDLHYPEAIATKTEQIENFEKCIELSIKHDLPVAVHTWDAFDETFLTLMKHRGQVRGVIHAFSYGPQEALKFVNKLGFFISFAGNLTYKKNTNLIEAMKIIPEDKIVCETDSPFLPPQKFRGKPNSPWKVTEVYKFIEETRGVPSEILTKNTTNLFGLDLLI